MHGKISLLDKSRLFLAYLDEWLDQLPEIALADIVGEQPDHVALFSIDMINGFCKHGPLSSDRVGSLVPSVVDIFQRAHDLGIRSLVLTQDSHTPDAPEFEAFPPHCIAGTPESQTVAEIAALPFSDDITVIPKNSLSSDLGTTLGEWMQERSDVTTFIVIGDCTDLCVYSAAMFLRLQANALNLKRRIIVPADAVNTYDTTVHVAHEHGIKAHDGDLHHVMFLHHMALNGIEVVARLT